MATELTFNSYVDNVLKTVCTADAAALPPWINRQLDEWELEAERPDGLPFAQDVAGALGQILDAVA